MREQQSPAPALCTTSLSFLLALNSTTLFFPPPNLYLFLPLPPLAFMSRIPSLLVLLSSLSVSLSCPMSMCGRGGTDRPGMRAKNSSVSSSPASAPSRSRGPGGTCSIVGQAGRRLASRDARCELYRERQAGQNGSVLSAPHRRGAEIKLFDFKPVPQPDREKNLFCALQTSNFHPTFFSFFFSLHLPFTEKKG